MERNTRQRTAIRRVIEEADRPLTPNEVRDAARALTPGVGIATVYRALKGLVEEGWLNSVELPGEPPRYERQGKAHHHHFHCNRCDRVFEVDGCAGTLPVRVPAGFELSTHEIVLYGLCASCSGRG